MKDVILGLLGCIALILIGSLMVAKPEWLWKLEHFLDTDGGSPLEWYKTKSRLGGVIF